MLKNKIALITGANRGIGHATAVLFAEQGATLYLHARNPGCLDSLCEEFHTKYKVNAYPVYFDVTRINEISAAFQFIFKKTKRLDILVNNVGILLDNLIGMVSEKEVLDTFSTNTFSMIHTCQYASRLMQKNKSGSIINVSSVIGCCGTEGQTVYSGSKAAVIGISKSLSKELASHNIRVNVVAPGFIDTDMVRSISKKKFNERIASIKMGRIGDPKEIANTILFLASELSSYVTGQVIGVDGGMLI